MEVCYLWILAATVPPRITNGDRKSWGYVQKRHFQSGRKTFGCGRCKMIPQGAHFTSLWNIRLIQQWMLSSAITQSDLCPRSWYQAFSERITGALSPGRAALLEISSGRSRLSGSYYKRSSVKQENIWWHSTGSSSSSSSSTVSYGALHRAISKLCGQLTAANATDSIKRDSHVSTEIRTPIIFNWINQPDATTSQIYCLSFKYGSTCFGHPHAHHQELQQLQ